MSATAPFIPSQTVTGANHPSTLPLEAAESAVSAAFLELLPKSEFLFSTDPSWIVSLLSIYNRLFAVGFKAMMVLAVILLLIFAPFVGIFSAGWSFAAAVFRQGALHSGKGVSDALGYGTFVRTKAAYIAWKRGMIRPSLAAPLPAEGVKPSSREDVLRPSELGFLPTPEELLFGRPNSFLVPGADNSCVSAPVRWFNAAFSFGFLVGTVIVAAATLLFAPFVGAFVSLWALAYSLVRSLSRAEGRLVLDILGVGELVAQKTALMKEEMTLGSSGPGSMASAAPTGVATGVIVTPNPLPMATAVYAAPIMAGALYPSLPQTYNSS